MMVERIEINLLPAEYRVHRRNFHLEREVVYPLIALVLTCLGLMFWSVNIENTKGICENEIKALDQEIAINRPIHEEIKKLRSDQILIGEKIRALERISVNREKWVRLMEELSSRLPEYTWLISIKEENSSPPVIHIEGRTYSFPEVANYMSQLKESEYVNSVDLSRIEQIDSQSRLFSFHISCEVNPDAKLSVYSEVASQIPGGNTP
jgi:Tfp pilus assembly protein PilN